MALSTAVRSSFRDLARDPSSTLDEALVSFLLLFFSSFIFSTFCQFWKYLVYSTGSRSRWSRLSCSGEYPTWFLKILMLNPSS